MDRPGFALLPFALAFALAALPARAAPDATATPSGDRGRSGDAVLHVPSPQWRDQVLYFVMTDRFDDGDPSNDDQHAGEFDPADTAKYNGGDFKGLEKHLDYIRGLGATGVWVTPPVLNRWWDPRAHHGGYHGYWAKDFSKVDPHLGTLADYQQLSRALHGRSMVLVQDIVLNHVADYFRYDGAWDPMHPAANFVREPDSVGDRAPTEAPFDRNDASKPEDVAAAIYHWTPDVRDYRDPGQALNWQMAGLDDLNSENPLVRQTLRRDYDRWITEAGVDAFRIDTAFYVPRAALADFLYSDDKDAPGGMFAAAQTGREFFHVFGEGFAIDKPFEETQAQRIEALMQGDGGRPLLPGMLNFPLYGAISDVFARGAPSAEMGHRITSMMRVHERPELMPSFLDNHDVDRFLAGGSEAGLQQGLLLLFTLPGIPTIYYGTEQGLRGQRAAMFAAGQGSGGKDNFDANAPMYRYIASLAKLRREHRVLSRGRPTVLADNAAGAGALAYRMSAGDDSLLVVFNTSDAPALLDNLELGLAADARLPLLFAIDASNAGREARAYADGRVSLLLPPRSGRVYALPVAAAAADEDAAPARPVSIEPLASAEVEGDFDLSGRAPPKAHVRVVADGALAQAQEVVADRDGRWHARVGTGAMTDTTIRHRVVAWAEGARAISAPVEFVVVRKWSEVADVEDPAGDDGGPAGKYLYPTDPGWQAHTLDIRRVRVESAGGALRVSVKLAHVGTTWNPPNGFDHVAFDLFVELPGQGRGEKAMPGQQDDLPDGMRWNRHLRAHGWSNALFSDDGASATKDGAPVSPAPTIVADPASDTVTFTFSASALGNPASLAGAKLYLNTWDYDGGFRPLQAQPAGARFGGGDGTRDPLWMDATTVIVLP
jgi:glycosidase